MPSVSAIIGANIRALRAEQHLSQIDLAVALGMATGTISAIERGQRAITVDELLPICEALDCDLQRLLYTLERGQWQRLGMEPPNR